MRQMFPAGQNALRTAHSWRMPLLSVRGECVCVCDRDEVGVRVRACVLVNVCQPSAHTTAAAAASHYANSFGATAVHKIVRARFRVRGDNDELMPRSINSQFAFNRVRHELSRRATDFSTCC